MNYFQKATLWVSLTFFQEQVGFSLPSSKFFLNGNNTDIVRTKIIITIYKELENVTNHV